MSLANEFRVGVAEREVTFNQDLRALVPSADVHGLYVARFLQASQAQILGVVDEASHGTKRLTTDRLREIVIPLPPLNEQRRIAAILDRADALRAKRRAALAQLDTLTQAIFVEMFGDPSTNPRALKVRRLGELISEGPQNGLYKHAADYGSGTPILRIDAFYDGSVTDLARLKRVRLSREEVRLYGLRTRDVVINRVNSREYLGKSAIIPPLDEPTVFESNMMRFTVDSNRLSPEFLISYLQSDVVRRHIMRCAKDAVNQSSINQQDVKSIPVLVPSLDEQNSFVRRARTCSAVLDAAQRDLATLDMLFASLQHRAFRGEL